SLRRATVTVAQALREEGDRARAEQLLAEVGDGLAAGTLLPPASDEAIPPGPSYDARPALAGGERDAFLAVADARLTESPPAAPRWRAVRAWLRALRGDAEGAVADVEQAVATARGTGFWRLTWAALAHGALAHAVLDDLGRGEALLAELWEGW